jgi:hypothetical protein
MSWKTYAIIAAIVLAVLAADKRGMLTFLNPSPKA